MSQKIYKPKYVKKILISQKEVKDGITKAANWINKRYSHCKKRPILLAILKGAVPFYAELVMQLHFDFHFDFMVLSSFRGQMKAVTQPKIVTDIMNDIKGRDVIVVEDVLDSAKTLTVLKKYLLSKKPNSLKFIVLADKVDLRQVPFKADYACFTIRGDKFLVGYGLDIKEIARNLPYIAEFDKKYLNKL
ncbi:MAG: hypoxanthine phosphoribosyltransferase [Mycoplasma sp.]|nr:hypoxanthine phosphoribosyltransferase [Candidatus Hennigella equi]